MFVFCCLLFWVGVSNGGSRSVAFHLSLRPEGREPPLPHTPPLTTANGLALLGLGAALVSTGERGGVWGGAGQVKQLSLASPSLPPSFPPLFENLQLRTPSLSTPFFKIEISMTSL